MVNNVIVLVMNLICTKILWHMALFFHLLFETSYLPSLILIPLCQ